ncbi:MAG: hypothetical protein V4858_12490 [Pseudomonadota bacterium]
MQTTLSLLDKALTIAPMPVWTEKLKVHRNALRNARNSGHLTPVLAGGLAVELNEDPAHWITTAVLEGEKESPAKQALIRQLEKMRKL